MDEKARNELEITAIYPNDDDNHNILYIRCKYQEDISSITALARNLPRDGDGEKPSLVTHIPSMFFERYQACEKILWGIRNQDKGRYQTNLRLGKTDLLLRYKEKNNTQPWSQIPTIKIPHSVPPPNTTLYKKPHQPQYTTQPHYTEDNNGGTMTGILQQKIQQTNTNMETETASKRKHSPLDKDQNKHSKPTNTELSSHWEVLADMDQDTETTENQDPLATPTQPKKTPDLTHYTQITRIQQLSHNNTNSNTTTLATITPITPTNTTSQNTNNHE